MKLKKGDEVKIIRGKEKGKTGKIEKVFPRELSVLIPGLNQYKRHKKARSQTEKSEIITIVKPLPIANVRLLCPKCHEMTRIGYEVKDNDKSRMCRKCGQTL